jgi:hypothetical protein
LREAGSRSVSRKLPHFYGTEMFVSALHIKTTNNNVQRAVYTKQGKLKKELFIVSGITIGDNADRITESSKSVTEVFV